MAEKVKAGTGGSTEEARKGKWKSVNEARKTKARQRRESGMENLFPF